MKNVLFLKAVTVDGERFPLAKAHVKGYTTGKGTFVAEHDDKRKAVIPHSQAGAYFPDHKQSIASMKDGDSINVKAGADTHKLTRHGSDVHMERGAGNSIPSGKDDKDGDDDSRNKKASSPHSDANEASWDKLHDDENPKYVLQTASSKALSGSAKGKDDLNHRAKVELAARGLDSHAKWVGFDAANAHHGVSKKEVEVDEPDEAAGHLQTAHSHVLAAAARGELDLNKRAKHELANRGQDSDGKWVGFDAANKHHGIDKKPQTAMRAADESEYVRPDHVKNKTDEYDHLSKIPQENRTAGERARIKKIVSQAGLGRHSDEYKAHQANSDKKPLSPAAVHKIADKHDDKMYDDTEWNHKGYKGRKVPAKDVAGVPEFTHKEVYGHDNPTHPQMDDFSDEFKKKKHQGFVLKHSNGKRSFVDTQGYGYARYHGAVGD